MKFFFRVVLALFAFLLGASASADDLIFIYDQPFGTVYSHGKPCGDGVKYGYDFQMNMRTMAYAHDQSFISRWTKDSINAAHMWQGYYACQMKDEEPLAVRVDVRFDGAKVGTLYATYKYPGLFDIRFEDLVEKPESEYSTALNKALTVDGELYLSGEIDYDDFDGNPYINQLQTMIPDVDAVHLPDLMYLVGYFYSMSYNMEIRASNRINNYKWNVQHENEDGQKFRYIILEEAAKMGSVPAAERVLIITSVLTEIYGALYEFSQQGTASLPTKAQDLLRRYGYIWDVAIDGKSGLVMSFQDQLNQAGYSVENGIMSLDPNLPPGLGAVERSLNDSLQESFNQVAGDVAQILKEVHGIEGAFSSCDETWCYFGPVGVRFSVRDRPQCEPVEQGETTCDFPFRLVVSITNGGTTPWNRDSFTDQLNDVMRAVRDAHGDQHMWAKLTRSQTGWTISDAEWTNRN